MIFVTGSNGLVGSHLLYYLTSKGEKVKALIRNKSKITQVSNIFSFYTKTPEQNLKLIEWIEGDVTDLLVLGDCLNDVTKVYHTAAYVSFNPRLKYKVLETNVKGTANLVNQCLEKKISKLCHVSSIGALGEAENGSLITEDIFWKPSKRVSTYSLSKYQAEMEVWRGITEGLNAVIVNPSVILGPGDWSKGSPAFFKFASQGINYYTEGVTGFVDVNDVVVAMELAMESEIAGERIILSSENLSYRDILNYFAETFNNNLPTKKASNFLLTFLQKLEYIRSNLLNTEPKLTSDTISIAQNTSKYSNQKSIDLLHISYKPVLKSIQEIASIYKINTR